MRSREIDNLLRKIRMLRLLSLLLQLVLIAIGVWIADKLLLLFAEKYFFHYPVASWLALGAFFLLLASRCVARHVFRTDSDVATQLDHEYALQERLSTYIELRSTNHAFLDALSRETESKVSRVSPFRAAHFTRDLAVPLIMLLTFLTATLVVPYLPVPRQIVARKEEKKNIREELRKLDQSLTQMEKQKPQNPDLKKLLAEFRKVTREMQSPKTTRAEALKELNALRERLRQYERNIRSNQEKVLLEAMRDAAQKGSAGDVSAADQKELEKLLDEMQDSLGESPLDSGGQVEELRQDHKLSAQSIEKLRKALEEYKAQKAESEKTMADLKKNLEKTQKGITSGSRKFTSDSTLQERDLEKGKGGVEDGPGTTNLDLGPQRFDTKKQGKSGYMEDRTKTQYEQLYRGRREEFPADPFFLDGQWNADDARYRRIRSFGLDSDSTTKASSAQAVEQSKEEAGVRREKIPAPYRKIVKKYFESIQE